MKLKSVIERDQPIDYQRGTLAIAQTNGIQRINSYTYTMPSKDGTTRYVITLDREHGDAVTCSCPIFSNRPHMACKHMLAVDATVK